MKKIQRIQLTDDEYKQAILQYIRNIEEKVQTVVNVNVNFSNEESKMVYDVEVIYAN